MNRRYLIVLLGLCLKTSGANAADGGSGTCNDFVREAQNYCQQISQKVPQQFQEAKKAIEEFHKLRDENKDTTAAEGNKKNKIKALDKSIKTIEDYVVAKAVDCEGAIKGEVDTAKGKKSSGEDNTATATKLSKEVDALVAQGLGGNNDTLGKARTCQQKAGNAITDFDKCAEQTGLAQADISAAKPQIQSCEQAMSQTATQVQGAAQTQVKSAKSEVDSLVGDTKTRLEKGANSLDSKESAIDTHNGTIASKKLPTCKSELSSGLTGIQNNCKQAEAYAQQIHGEPMKPTQAQQEKQQQQGQQPQGGQKPEGGQGGGKQGGEPAPQQAAKKEDDAAKLAAEAKQKELEDKMKDLEKKAKEQAAKQEELEKKGSTTSPTTCIAGGIDGNKGCGDQNLTASAAQPESSANKTKIEAANSDADVTKLALASAESNASLGDDTVGAAGRALSSGGTKNGSTGASGNSFMGLDSGGSLTSSSPSGDGKSKDPGAVTGRNLVAEGEAGSAEQMVLEKVCAASGICGTEKVTLAKACGRTVPEQKRRGTDKVCDGRKARSKALMSDAKNFGSK